MNLSLNLKPLRFSLLAVALCCAGAAQAQTAATMSGTEYGAAKDRIQADYKADRAACDKLNANAKDICVAEAKGKEKVAEAELKYQRSGKADDANKVQMVKADAAYDVAKERCDDMKGNDKDVCVKEAKANEAKAKADAKAAKKTGEARHDAVEDKRDADYKVAAEKCDSMAGAAKDNCMQAAKARFGKQ